MICGDHNDMRQAVKRLYHFRDLFPADGPFTSITPFGRNLAMFHDFGVEEDAKDAIVSDMVICAGAGRVLAKRCDEVLVSEAVDTQADIASWWWRANRAADMRVFFGMSH